MYPTNFGRYVFIIIKNSKKFLLRLSLWPMCYWKLCFSISKYRFVIFLLLISNFILSWSESTYCIHCIHSTILNALRYVFWPRMWYILVNVPRELEKKMYSAVVWWSILQILMRSSLIHWCGYWVQLCPRWFSACWLHLFLVEGCWSFYLC